MEIVDRSKATSKVREQQMELFAPMQYYFVTEYEENIGLPKDVNRAGLYKSFKSNPTLNLVTYPIERGQIQVRLENLADRFDYDYKDANAPSSAFWFNLTSLVQDLYLEANPGTQVPNYTITELSLSGNQLIGEEDKHKKALKWIGEDDK